MQALFPGSMGFKDCCWVGERTPAGIRSHLCGRNLGDYVESTFEFATRHLHLVSAFGRVVGPCQRGSRGISSQQCYSSPCPTLIAGGSYVSRSFTPFYSLGACHVRLISSPEPVPQQRWRPWQRLCPRQPRNPARCSWQRTCLQGHAVRTPLGFAPRWWVARRCTVQRARHQHSDGAPRGPRAPHGRGRAPHALFMPTTTPRRHLGDPGGPPV